VLQLFRCVLLLLLLFILVVLCGCHRHHLTTLLLKTPQLVRMGVVRCCWKHCHANVQAPHDASMSLRALLGPGVAGLDIAYVSRINDLHSASSVAKAVPMLKDKQDTSDPLLLMYRPASAHGLPLALVDPLFGQLQDSMSSGSIDSKDVAMAQHIINSSSKFYANEGLRYSAVLKACLPEYLRCTAYGVSPKAARQGVESADGSLIWSSSTSTSSSSSSASSASGRACLVYIKAKNEMGVSGDAYVQGTAYYAKDVASDEYCHWVARSRCPALLLELVGPNMRVSGLALQGGKVSAQPLTDYITLLQLPGAEHIGRIARVLAALRRMLPKLAMHYSLLQATPPAATSPALSPLPYPLLGVQGAAPATMGEPAQHRQLLYQVATSEGALQLVKFCQRYGHTAHTAWASRGLAVPLLDYHELPGGWKMVCMENLSKQDGWRTLEQVLEQGRLAAEARVVPPQLADEARRLLCAAHDVVVDGQRLVHGDVRNRNLMVRRVGEPHDGLWQALLIDLDWAAPQGCAYPLGINPWTTWAAGVGPGAAMQQQHDVEMLEMALSGASGAHQLGFLGLPGLPSSG
jgi:hypothetical protein